MIFHELYSAYYLAVAHILQRAVEGKLTASELRPLVERYAYAESALEILPALRDGRWPLLRSDFSTPLHHVPSRPMTVLERRFLKSLLLDPRVALFGLSSADFDGLADVAPLFTPADYRVYDKYADGDPFEDEGYITRFRLILAAIHNRAPLWITMKSRKGNRMHLGCRAERLEYSEKDDKFRLITSGCRYGGTVNLGRILECRLFDGPFPSGGRVPAAPRPPVMQSVTLTVTNTRNALERVMLHFAHFEKRAEHIEGNRYRLTVRYAREDETELLIRILSFGPHVRVDAPENMVNCVRERLRMQMERGIR